MSALDANEDALRLEVAVAAPAPVEALAVPSRRADRAAFTEVYRAWFHKVCTWLRAMGGRDEDLDDLAQEVFVVVERQLPGFDGVNLAGWLYGIARRVIAGHRRRTWYRHLFLRRSDAPLEGIASTRPDAVELMEAREKRRALDAILARIGDKRREVFVLFEIEEYSGAEIAELIGVPLNTVWTRLHHARKDFFRLAAVAARSRGARPADAATARGGR